MADVAPWCRGIGDALRGRRFGFSRTFVGLPLTGALRFAPLRFARECPRELRWDAVVKEGGGR